MRNLSLCISLFILISCSINLTAQPPFGGGGKQGGGMKGMPFDKRPPIMSVQGLVKDESTGDPLEFANISLLLAKNDSLVNGGITDQKGRFYIDKVRPARYKMKIEFIGYEAKIIEKVPFKRGSMEMNIGEVSLNVNSELMEAVEITEDKPFVINSIDKKIYDPNQLQISAGSSSVEALEQLPSVELDVDNNISLRGSQNVRILIDGRPSGLDGSDRSTILEAIPANSIEKIEIVTNPSAKYDPDGMSGIINIVLKKNRKAGINGTVTAGIGTNNKYNAGASLNYRTPKFNIFSNYGFNYRETYRERTSSRSFDTGTAFSQEGRTDILRRSHLIKGGIDYFLTRQSTLGLTGTFNLGNNSNTENILYQHLLDNSDAVIDSSYNRSNSQRRNRNSADLALNYSQKFNQDNQELDVLLSYYKGPNDELGDFKQSWLDPISNELLDISPSLERNEIDRSSQNIIAQLDYTHPIGENITIETGYKSIFRTIDDSFLASTFNADSDIYEIGTDNSFEYEDHIHAVYALYGQKINNFSFKIGSRFEQALTEGRLLSSDTPYENDYFSIFPSVFLSQKLGENGGDITLNYTRRINRPRTRQLFPFANTSDPLFAFQGNPNLNPEYIDSYELGYSKFWKSGFMLNTSLYYRKVNDVISRNIQLVSDQRAVVTYVNFSTAKSYGAEVSGSAKLAKWWRVNGSFNIYNTQVDGSNVEGDLTTDALGWSGRLMSNFKLWKGADLQLMTWFVGPRIIPRGKIKAFRALNATIKQSFWNKKATVSLGVRDILNQLKFDIDVERNGFHQLTLANRESRIATLSFSYRFGKQDMKKRRRSDRGRGQGGGGGFDDGGGGF